METKIYTQVDLRRELVIPFVVVILSFLLWMFNEVMPAKIIIFLFIILLVLKNPLAGVLFFLANESFIGTVPPDIAGISVMQFTGGLCIISAMSKKLRFPSLKNTVSLLALAITITFAISNWRYFGEIDFSIFNNYLFFVITLWVLDFGESSQVRQAGYTLIMAAVLILGITFLYFIYDPMMYFRGPFGNPRQVSFFGILVIPYIYIILNFVKNITVMRYTLRALLLIIIVYSVLSGGRLNIFILLVFLLIFYSSLFQFNVQSRRIKFAVLLLGVLFLVSSNWFASFLTRDVVHVGKVTELFALDEPSIYAFTQGRSAMYERGIEMFKDYPLFGGGYERWNHITNQYNSFLTLGSTARLSMHSTLIRYLAETGIVGLGLYLAFLLAIMRISLKAIRSANAEPLSPIIMCGCIGFVVALAVLLGGTFDNHGLQYRQLFFAAAAAIGIYSPRLKRDSAQN